VAHDNVPPSAFELRKHGRDLVGAQADPWGSIRNAKDTGLRNPPLRGFDQNRSGASWWPTRWVNQIAQSTTSSDSRPGPGINTLRPNTCIHQSCQWPCELERRKI